LTKVKSLGCARQGKPLKSREGFLLRQNCTAGSTTWGEKLMRLVGGVFAAGIEARRDFPQLGVILDHPLLRFAGFGQRRL
jgi:hypothetical protein